ncbi:uncharacterized protein LOC119340246 [Triticum dicoccoides]|uniref:uncharacterized protein LOC119340246 n=1 Tax=Triticum dicoccoides TaxID=85692 RepID=UPI000E7AEE3E|nr:uncharacterized protein LOC119340246 [Triticum dicoccoides]
MGGKGFHADKLPEKEGDGLVASGWGRLKRAVGMETPGGEADHLPDDSRYDRVGRDGVRIPRIKYSDPGAITQVVDFARAVPMMVQAAAAKTIELAKAKMEEVAKNRRG